MTSLRQICPPKLLDIPHEGLSRFVTPGFASNLARREEPNIDVDAEGGMPIDLPSWPPSTHKPSIPLISPLLMTLDQLRNPAPKNTNVSFLRRTQHISVDRAAAATATGAPARPQARSTKKGKTSVDDPKHIKKYIQKGFDIAHPESKHSGEDTESSIRGLPATKTETDAWAKPVHPDNPKLKPVGFFPILPDLQGFTDPGGFLQFKFDKAPIPTAGGRRDKRLDVAILRPIAPEERICQEHASKVALHKAGPDLYADPGAVPWDYDLLLPEKLESAKNVRTSMNLNHPNRDNEELYTNDGPDGNKYHRYDRVRTFATSGQVINNDKLSDIAISLNSGDGNDRQRAAFYYPIVAKTRLKPERARTIAQAGLAPGASQVEEERVDQMQVTIRDPDESEVYKRAPPVEEEEAAEEDEQPAEDDDEDTRMSDE
ncbi:hypothetical protein N7481_011380 [Penicillium waksmanii]|uniref:uncharacterized protein n=1 Tax=Penicillium waksmanii TaxID=69791 RepID=UPI0025467DB4|nr:uncharacterized protein N7481_011380 [Penicillium waksmanii]KAJ5974170.1 hypothetical protein N7481_011380 [Penicillium waksmanii]